MARSRDYLQKVIDAVRGAFDKGQGAAGRLSEGSRSAVHEWIPTGIEVIDHYLVPAPPGDGPVGGLPVGRCSEWFSEEGAGKTISTLQFLASAQRAGAVTILCECENGVDPGRAAVVGLDPEQLVLIEADDERPSLSMEDALEGIAAAMSALPDKAPPALVVWDSLAATPTRKEIAEGLEGKEAIGERARVLSHACRVLGGLMVRHRCHLLLVNQTRHKIGVLFGNTTTTPGGQAVKFLASLRVELFGGKAVKDDAGAHTGKVITYLAVKNRFATPYRKVQVRLDYERGFDNAWSTVNHAKDRKLVEERARPSEATHADALVQLGWDKGGEPA